MVSPAMRPFPAEQGNVVHRRQRQSMPSVPSMRREQSPPRRRRSSRRRRRLTAPGSNNNNTAAAMTRRSGSACSLPGSPPPWLYGKMTREKATAMLQISRNGGSAVLCSNVFLVREKVPNLSYAISLLVPSSTNTGGSVYLNSSTPSNEYVSMDSLSVVHHLVERSTRVDKTPGRHFVFNDEVRMPHCTTIEEVIHELSKPDNTRMAELPASLGLPLLEACVKTCTGDVASVKTDAWACPACSTPFCTFVGADQDCCAACPELRSALNPDYVSFTPHSATRRTSSISRSARRLPAPRASDA